MLGNKDAAANIAVKDLEKAKEFYEDTLGLTQVDAEGQEVIVFKSGNSKVNVYQSQYAGTNQATTVDMGGRREFGGCRATTKSKRKLFSSTRICRA